MRIVRTQELMSSDPSSVGRGEAVVCGPTVSRSLTLCRGRGTVSDVMLYAFAYSSSTARTLRRCLWPTARRG
jgi:hypothetical protein